MTEKSWNEQLESNVSIPDTIRNEFEDNGLLVDDMNEQDTQDKLEADIWKVAYEIYCAGGYVDNGSEPNPPTDGIRELLARQTAITEREARSDFHGRTHKLELDRSWWIKMARGYRDLWERAVAKRDERDEHLHEQVRSWNVLESIKALRECIDEHCDKGSYEYFKIMSQVSEVEHEISKNYIERDKVIEAPLDADGVPIYVGDRLSIDVVVWRLNNDEQIRKDYFIVSAIGKNRVFDDNGNGYTADECHHAKQRVAEDVLRDVWNEALDYAKSDVWRNPNEVFAERANELRDMFSGDE